MEIPVTGFVFHNEQSGSDHSHVLYITTWNGRPVHVHQFAGVTSFDVGHRHQYAGTTEPAPSGVPHVHGYSTVTSFDDGHTHTIRGTTGPAIPLQDVGHIHYFEGSTTVDGMIPHSHRYSGNTGNEIS
ncbi:YmaF family protein [Paenibacillus sp. sptzw28]|uniref:YmaF family protein n=1 Tax=Paenibacillus sp. sptzw28 TaxID=715179 RepID=UPI001C6F1302|nr:YmaF family protein [Paenibacillus sp. sptzw28]QYR24246.1 YmaF family protein [Paenibacillus sp. sptzw28]